MMLLMYKCVKCGTTFQHFPLCKDTSNKTMQCHSHLGLKLCSMLDKVDIEIFNG